MDGGDGVLLAGLTITGGIGGLDCRNSNLSLSNVTITGNMAEQGAGIYSTNSNLTFSSENRCNIYLNNLSSPGRGADIYSDTQMEVIVDTFTVMNPTDYYATPSNNFSFDILNSVRGQVEANLFVAVNGNNSNDGLSSQTPLKTIQYATSIILADQANRRTIYLEDGNYSPLTNGEIFPIDIYSYVSLTGESELGVVLDADSTATVMEFDNSRGSNISNLTITGGSSNSGDQGGGVYCYQSFPIFESVTIRDNGSSSNLRKGGGFYCLESSPTLRNVTISGNRGRKGGGFFGHESNPSMQNVTIFENHAQDSGGGILLEFSSASLSNVLIQDNVSTNHGGGIKIHVGEPGLSLDSVTIINNSAETGGGIDFAYCRDNPTLKNILIADNSMTESSGGGIYCSRSNLTFSNTTIVRNTSVTERGGIRANWEASIFLVNCILWDNTPEEVFFNEYGGTYSIIMRFCDIRGGENGIIENDYGTVFWGAGNIDSNPFFCNSGDLDYHLSANSPCVGSGTNGSNMGALAVGCSLPVDIVHEELPGEYALHQNFPNPFNPTTTISYSLPEQATVKLTIFDIQGREIMKLQDEKNDLGNYSIQWSGLDQQENQVSTGVYFCRLEAGTYSQTIKMLFLK